MIVVTGHIKMPPEQLANLRPHMRAVLEGTRAEDGCILYAYAEDVLEPGLIRIVERWRDWPSLEAHTRAPHIALWSSKVKEAGGLLDREVTAHEAGAERAL